MSITVAAISGKKKTWLTDGTVIITALGKREVRLNKAHHQSPSRTAEKRKRAASRFYILSESDWKRREGLWPDRDYRAYVVRKERQIQNLA